MSVLLRSRDGGIETLTLNRPDSMNALNDDLRDALLSAFAEVREDDEVRCLVLEGAGPGFCAGGDLDQMRSRDPEEVTAQEYYELLVETSQTLSSGLYDLPVPTVAKVDGVAVGAGLGIALACDLVVASEDARFGAAFRNVGLGPDTGVSYTLTRLAGRQAALELLYTGRVIDAAEAASLNLVTRVVPPEDIDDAVADLVATIADGPPLALAATKELVYGNQTRSMDDALDREAEVQARLSTTRDHEEGVDAFVDDRDPQFRGE